MFVPATPILHSRLAVAAALAATLALFAAAALLMAESPAATDPVPRDGVLDLRGWDVAADPTQALGSGWAFYWDALLPPDAFPGAAGRDGAATADMPAAWHGRLTDGPGKAGRGVATYHLRLLLPDRHPPLALRLPVTYSASILWANGTPLIVNGTPARGFAAERRVVQDRIAILPPVAVDGPATLDLVLQVSNHMVLSGGPTRTPAIGTPDALYQQFGRQVARDLFVVGACVVVGLFFLVLFATRPRERGFAWFGAFCLVIGVIYAHLSDVPMLFWPDLLAPTPNVYLMLLLLSAPTGEALFLMVLSALYPREISRRLALVAGALLAAYPAVMVAGRIAEPDLLSPRWEAVQIAAHAVFLACLAYGIGGVTIAALRRRRGAPIAAAAVLIFAAAALHDLSALHDGAAATPLIGAGLLVLVFAYAAILGGRLNAAVAAAETLSQDLRQLNLTLERKVADRTAELAQAAQRAEAADRAKSLFLTAANHDLRQPLHAMALIVGALDARLKEPALREMVTTLQGCLAGTRRLLAGMLDIARLDAGVVRAECEACELAPLLAQAATELRPLAIERGVRLRLVNIDHAVMADAAMLGRIVANLVGNAIKYAPGGRVLIGCRRQGDHVRLEIRDDGVGIAPEDQETIFAAFQQGAPPPGQAREGLGLGLSIARRFAQAMDTEIALRSAPGRGACFSLTLPAGLRRAPAPPAPDDLAGLRVLVVDGDAGARGQVAALLAAWGCLPIVAADPAAARAALAQRPDILIVDGDQADLVAEIGRDLPAAIIADAPVVPAVPGLPVLRRPIRPGNLASLLRHLARRRVRLSQGAA